MFHDRPPTNARKPWQIVRVGVEQPLLFIAGSRYWKGKFNHWFGGKTIECVGENECVACKSGRKPRWEGYIVGIGVPSGARALVCLTAAAAGDLDRYELGPHRLLGARITLKRKGPNVNGGVYAAIDAWQKVARETSMDDLANIVETIYGHHRWGPVTANGIS